jgi:hypothetical protein
MSQPPRKRAKKYRIIPVYPSRRTIIWALLITALALAWIYVRVEDELSWAGIRTAIGRSRKTSTTSSERQLV